MESVLYSPMVSEQQVINSNIKKIVSIVKIHAATTASSLITISELLKTRKNQDTSCGNPDNASDKLI